MPKCTLMDGIAASRIQSAEAIANSGGALKGGFAARAQSAAARNFMRMSGNGGGDGGLPFLPLFDLFAVGKYGLLIGLGAHLYQNPNHALMLRDGAASLYAGGRKMITDKDMQKMVRERVGSLYGYGKKMLTDENTQKMVRAGIGCIGSLYGNGKKLVTDENTQMVVRDGFGSLYANGCELH